MDNNAPTAPTGCWCKCHEPKWPRRVTGTTGTNEISTIKFSTLQSGGSPSSYPQVATITTTATMPSFLMG